MTDSKLHDELISALHKFIKEKGLLFDDSLLPDKFLNEIRRCYDKLIPHYFLYIFDSLYANRDDRNERLLNLNARIDAEWEDITNNITIKYAIRLLKKQNRLTYRAIRCWYNHMPITYKHILEFLKFDGQKYIANNIFMTYDELLTICDNIKKES